MGAGGVVALALTVALGALQGFPNLAVLALFGSLVVLSENNQIDLSTNVTISPHLLFVLAATVAFDGHATIVGAALCGAAGGLVLRYVRRRQFAAVAVNVAQFGLSAAAAGLAYETFFHRGLSSIAVDLLVPVVYLVVNIALVMPVICRESGLVASAVWRDLRGAIVLDLCFGVLGLMLGRLYVDVGPLAALAVLAPAVIARAVYGLLRDARSALTRVEALYGFTKELEGSGSEAGTAEAILDRVRELLRVRAAEVTILTADGWWRSTNPGIGNARVHTTRGTGRPVEVEAMVAGALISRNLAAGSPLGDQLAERRLGDAMLAPLRVEDTNLVGTLTVADRLGGAPFSPDDLRLLETVANHAAMSLSNSRLVDQLRWDSTHDRLTGLVNRDHFNELIAELPTSCAVLLVDLDRFKEINDTLGHGCGDDLLRAVAARLSTNSSVGSVVARLGGDEFGVLLPATGSGDAAQAAAALLTSLEQPFDVDGLELEVTASVGVAVGDGTTVGDGAALRNGRADATRLLQQADVAMYTAKSRHSGWEQYSVDHDYHNPRRLALAGELRRAIRRGELEVHYQPKARLGSVSTCGVEALVRWQHPRYGLLGPDSFVAVAEGAGLIKPLTLFVLRQAAAQQRELRRMGFDLGVAVNLSVRSVLDVNLPDQVAAVIAAHQMRACDLTLEITEGSIMADPARTIGILGRLSELGVQIALDDFGTGYSSLAYLKRLPADEVKIDRSFTAGVVVNNRDEAIVASTIGLAHHLGLRVVAEGVEDGATWSRLTDLGCDQAQGYYVSPPLTPPGLRSWLERSPHPIDLLPEPRPGCP